MRNGNGNGATAGSCPHGCSRCRAIELGLDHRPLTQAELILVHGGVVEPIREGRIVYSQETNEAQLALEVAQVTCEDARRAYGEVLASASAKRRKAGLDVTAQFNRERALESAERGRALESAERAALEELNEARDAAQKAGRRYRALAARDSERHRVARLVADQATQAAAKKERSEARTSSRKGALARLRP